ncbi:MAG: hypothetical protein ACJ77M_16700 [Thermoleophilaceae bacterium]
MATMTIDLGLAQRLRADLAQRPEEVGFFLADYNAERNHFVLREWRFIEEAEVASRGTGHVVLADEMRGALIRWASSAGRVLVEAHSHGPRGIAGFSTSDLIGFQEWVPHVRWRLQGRPYAAIVLAGEHVDAMAWIDGSRAVEPIDHIEVLGGEPIVPTGNTLEYLRRAGHG